MISETDLDRITRTALSPAAPTEDERRALWEAVERRLDAPRAGRIRAAGTIRRPRLLAASLATAAAASIAVALFHAGQAGGPPGRGLLDTASAAEVLRAAADHVILGVPGAGEQLHVRLRRVVPLGAGQQEVRTTSEWVAADGSGRTKVSVTAPGRRRASVTTERHAAHAPRSGDAFDSWRGLFTAEELQALPTARGPLLGALRAAVGDGIAATGDADLDVYGRDLGVVGAVVNLLTAAPLDAERRAALLDLLATAPTWTTPGSSATPLRVRRLGGATADGVRLRVDTHLTAAEQKRTSTIADWQLEITIDPRRGRITRVREYEGGPDAPPEVTTIEVQRIVRAQG
jgi:hypothetical protein